MTDENRREPRKVFGNDTKKGLATVSSATPQPSEEPDPNVLPEGTYAVVELPDNNPWDRRGGPTPTRNWGPGVPMSFLEANRSVWVDNYATFSGRASRSELWWAYLSLFVVSAVLSIPSLLWAFSVANQLLAATAPGAAPSADPFTVTSMPLPVMIAGLASTVLSFATIIPLLAVLTRRLHDTEHSGWILLGLLIPFVGFFVSIYVFILTLQRGTHTANTLVRHL